MPRGLLVVLLLIVHAANAQFIVPRINGWRVHLPYHTNQSLTQSGTTMYAGSTSGIFSYDQESGEVEVLNKTNVLSDVEVQKLEFDPVTSTLIIAYKNTNIDLISGGRTYNISNILNQSIIGQKMINDIMVDNGFAYLACTFGIVKIDLRKRQIVDSYQNIGTNGSAVNILDLAVFNNQLFASSHVGLFSASLNSGNLSDFNFWTNIYPDSTAQLGAYSGYLLIGKRGKLVRYNGIAFDSLADVSAVSPVSNIRVMNGNALIIQSDRIVAYNASFTPSVFNENGILDALGDKNGHYYASIMMQGIVHFEPAGNTYIGLGGPYATTALKFNYSPTQKKLFVAGGSVDGIGIPGGWKNSYNRNGYYVFDGSSWSNSAELKNPLSDRCIDMIDVVSDKSNKTYFTSFNSGLLELTNGTPTQVYDTSNTNGHLGYFVNEVVNYRPIFAAGTTIDESGNLWVTSYGAANPLAVKTKSGQWSSVRLSNGVNTLGYITCDNNSPRNNKWIMNPRSGDLYAYNEGSNLSSDNDDKLAVLTTEKGKGALPSKYVLTMALDKNGELWIGTDAGLCIISDPTAVFSNDSRRNYDARQLIFNTGSFNSIFLGTDAILCIKVDGANRKWIGTRNGVWLVSEDGYTVIRNFTTENSPLLSNTVYDIGIFEETGEVFFATDKGIISYAGNATQADAKHGNVLVYPNPVKPGFTGDIAIRGLVENANVKITDIAGNLVYETKANGGMATWNGITFTGKRAATGVYLIYSTGEEDANGERDTYVTKLLFVN